MSCDLQYTSAEVGLPRTPPWPNSSDSRSPLHPAKSEALKFRQNEKNVMRVHPSSCINPIKQISKTPNCKASNPLQITKELLCGVKENCLHPFPNFSKESQVFGDDRITKIIPHKILPCTSRAGPLLYAELKSCLYSPSAPWDTTQAHSYLAHSLSTSGQGL